jgi:ATP-binding cassette subfamily B protein
MAYQFLEIVRCVFMVVSAAAVMLALEPSLTLLAFVTAPVIIALSLWFFRIVMKRFLAADEAESRMTTVLQENLTGMRIVRAFANQDREIEKFETACHDYRDKDFRISRMMAWYWSVSDLLCDAQIGTVLVAGTWLAVDGRMSVGTLIAFLSYTGGLIWPIRNLGRMLADMGRASVSLGRVNEVLANAVESAGAPEAGEAAAPKRAALKPEIAGAVEFDHVGYGYVDGKPVLDDISFRVRAGETIGILGSTGSGKTTLVSLLVRLFDYQKGSIRLDGVELKDIDRRWVRRHVGIVLQEPFLFSRTIRENLAMSRADVSAEEMERVTRIASVHDVIMDFEEGYDTMVGEKGVTLSGGQKQRVAIARTLLNNSRILIFDDSLSAVDVGTDALIREQLRLRCAGTTTFIVSHRVSTLRAADRILVLDGGRLAQEGTHEELLSREGIYRRVSELQELGDRT